MDVKDLVTYLDELQQQRERALATVHAVDGAIQAVQTLLHKAANEPKPAAQPEVVEDSDVR